MYSSAKRRRIKPYARPTSFDFNAAFDIRHYQRIKYGNIIDPYFPAVGTDEAFQVMEGEILMQTQKPGVRRYGDHQMHVFSFANGLEGRGSRLNASASGSLNGEGGLYQFDQKADVMANLKYAGVAVTGFKPDVDVFEQGFVITVAGLNTLFNSGHNTLYPGDIICADIPNPADKGARKNRALQTGIPHEKLQFVITPFSKLKNQITPKEASRFIMGTALSYSKPGTPVDVVLHKCNVIHERDDDSDDDDDSADEDDQSSSSSESPNKKKTKKRNNKKINKKIKQNKNKETGGEGQLGK